MKKAILPALLLLTALTVLAGGGGKAPEQAHREIGKALETRLDNTLSQALEGLLALPRTYWLRDAELVAPRPRPQGWGSAESPEERTVPEDFYFGPDTELMPGSEIRYYEDETILAVTWKEVHNQGVYTFSEVKIAHPSQLRRFLAGGEYGSSSPPRIWPQASTPWWPPPGTSTGSGSWAPSSMRGRSGGWTASLWTPALWMTGET